MDHAQCPGAEDELNAGLAIAVRHGHRLGGEQAGAVTRVRVTAALDAPCRRLGLRLGADPDRGEADQREHSGKLPHGTPPRPRRRLRSVSFGHDHE